MIQGYDPDYDRYSVNPTTDRFEEMHFRIPRSTEEITEHAALTAFLYFWVKLHTMIEVRLVSPSLARELFRGPYEIYGPFIAEFREAVRKRLDGADEPSWFRATEQLDSFLLGTTPNSATDG